MALLSGSSTLRLRSSTALDSVTHWVQGLFGYASYSPEAALAETKNIDPYFLPRVPMSAGNLDAGLLNELSHMGMRRAKQITHETHPELTEQWEAMCLRAGLKKAPQLILAESKTVNALTVSPEEVVLTTGLLKLINLRELMAVLGHELGHETSNHKTPRMLASLLLGGVGSVAGHQFGERLGAYNRYLKQGDHFIPSGLPLETAFYEAAFIGAGLMVGNIAANQLTVRPTELDADKKGAKISGDPQGLISALQKLDAQRSKSPIKNFFAYLQSGYPTMGHRIRKLEEMAEHAPAALPIEAPLSPAASSQPGSHVTQISADARLKRTTLQHAIN